MNYTVTTFGYKYGVPKWANPHFDVVVDCRSIPNPSRNPKLRELTGLDEKVRDSVMRAGGLDLVVKTIERLEESQSTNIFFGCMGGRHRSVAVGEMVAGILAKYGHRVDIIHTELDGKKSKKSA